MALALNNLALIIQKKTKKQKKKQEHITANKLLLLDGFMVSSISMRNQMIINIIYSFSIFFHASVSQLFLTGVWVTWSLQDSSQYSGWSQ